MELIGSAKNKVTKKTYITDSHITHGQFVSGNYVLTEYDDLKEQSKNTSVVSRNFQNVR